jgi:hypothetical protein
MTQQWPEEAMFFRQINPKHFSESGPTSQAFIPFPKDKGGLSVDDRQLITAGQSWERATKVCGPNSCGTWGVSKHDVETASSLEIKPDPQLCNKAHCLVIFPDLGQEGLTKNAIKREWKKRAQYLAIRATARGPLYRPDLDVLGDR